LSAKRFTKALTNYVFSESLIIEDYENIFIPRHVQFIPRRFTKALTNYIFSESLIIEDYENIFR